MPRAVAVHRRHFATLAAVAILEAAHIKPYRGKNDHNPENGLLFRADIHTLFDLNLLGIEPKTPKVKPHPALHKEYGPLVSKLFCAPHAPSYNVLSVRYADFEKRRTPLVKWAAVARTFRVV